ncbi:agmatine/peptidylarginine deiminase [Nocardioides sp.]|uniref:agmatine deiminase family protein n=1 Tax=Nocardioides sp. TaxID=35761 RepID=UPI0035173D41
MNWRMPAETEPQERVWMAFPPSASYVADDPEEAHRARSAWARVAAAIVDFEPVTMVVDPAEVEIARTYLDERVDIVTAPLDDAWMRDTGPSFVLDEEGRLGAVDWVFNGWGQQSWAAWDDDEHIGAFVADRAGAKVESSPMVNEGGAIHVDGLGTVLVTQTVQLDPHRNPGWTRADVEAELARTIGARHVVWLPRGLYRDSLALGTRGHVDMTATIASPGVLLVHVQNDPMHPDHAITREILEALRASHDADGRPWRIIEVPAPLTVRDEENWVDYSYINHLVVNGGVIGCAFDDPRDADAKAILEEAYPGRTVVMVPARDIFAGGGGIHCITQQQPATPTRAGR